MQEYEFNNLDEVAEHYEPNSKKWSAAALDAWEKKVDEEIKQYLLIPCKYHGPDLDY